MKPFSYPVLLWLVLLTVNLMRAIHIHIICTPPRGRLSSFRACRFSVANECFPWYLFICPCYCLLKPQALLLIITSYKFINSAVWPSVDHTGDEYLENLLYVVFGLISCLIASFTKLHRHASDWVSWWNSTPCVACISSIIYPIRQLTPS